MKDLEKFVLPTFRYYKTVLGEDSTHVEAIACIGKYNCFKHVPLSPYSFLRHEPFLLGPTRTEPEVLSEAPADGHRSYSF